ncbi:MAG: alpha/beta hydrolase [Glaciihabitans sp.]|nr:alpha/beta hydrolase [Glaciihabitans sp.]
MPGQSVVYANSVELCVEEFGDAGDPAILLIAGGAASMDWWDTALCERLAAGGRRVVRYDFRDTGRSVTYPPGEPGYTGADLVDDAAALITTLGLAPAHVVGLSMGGGIAQHLAIRFPELVASLTLMSTTPAAEGTHDDEELPSMEEKLAASFDVDAPVPDWSDEEAVGAYFIDTERLFSGSIPVDEDRIRRIVGEEMARGGSFGSANNNFLTAGDDDDVEPLATISAPTLVLHGTEDPVFPVQHGEALAREIPGAKFMPIVGMGHQHPPPPTWDQVVPALLAHTAH